MSAVYACVCMCVCVECKWQPLLSAERVCVCVCVCVCVQCKCHHDRAAIVVCRVCVRILLLSYTVKRLLYTVGQPLLSECVCARVHLSTKCVCMCVHLSIECVRAGVHLSRTGKPQLVASCVRQRECVHACAKVRGICGCVRVHVRARKMFGCRNAYSPLQALVRAGRGGGRRHESKRACREECRSVEQLQDAAGRGRGTTQQHTAAQHRAAPEPVFSSG